MRSKFILILVGIIILIPICNANNNCDCSMPVKNSTLPDLIITVKVQSFNLSFDNTTIILPEEKDIF